MTENEAIEVLKDFGKQVSVKADGAYQSTIGEKACDVAIKALEEVQKYRAIGTPEECRAAVEKQTAKRPNHVTHSYSNYMWHKEHIGYCPDCGHKVEEPYGCQNCLRKIDWSDEE